MYYSQVVAAVMVTQYFISFMLSFDCCYFDFELLLMAKFQGSLTLNQQLALFTADCYWWFVLKSQLDFIEKLTCEHSLRVITKESCCSTQPNQMILVAIRQMSADFINKHLQVIAFASVLSCPQLGIQMHYLSEIGLKVTDFAFSCSADFVMMKVMVYQNFHYASDH